MWIDISHHSTGQWNDDDYAEGLLTLAKMKVSEIQTDIEAASVKYNKLHHDRVKSRLEFGDKNVQHFKTNLQRIGKQVSGLLQQLHCWRVHANGPEVVPYTEEQCRNILHGVSFTNLRL